ncbi:hypothetical protein KVP08_014445 [Shewanella putrefaciens]|nr:hypothetical protein KVP08_014445 [Shewanella putrefaciens]
MTDQDDVWFPNKVKKLMLELERYDFVVSDCKVVDADLNLIHQSHFSIHNVKKGFVHNFLLPRYIGACMAFHRCILDYALPFPPQQKYSAHDYWISLIAEMSFRVKVINEPLILYRRHGSNASNGGTKSKNTLLHKLSVRIYTGVSLIKRWFDRRR